ncbi:MAG TPA: glycosyltransferase family 4 protein [Steroidobacteraceae bacterium]|jgi:glycosyltransferase involved in cell wall biosynthesis
MGIRGMPNVQGGVETHAEHLYTQLAALGCEVEVLVRSPYVPRGQRHVGSIRLRRIWSPKRRGLEAFVHSILCVLYAGVSRPDILHIHAVGPAIVTPIARLIGLRVVVTHHGPDYVRDKWGRFARWVLRTGERVGMRYSHARIAVSRVIANLIQLKYGCTAEFIPNGVAPAVSHSGTEHVERFGLEPGRYFLQISRMVPEKRQLDLIRAFTLARPSGWRLALVGGLDGDPYSRAVEIAAREAGVVVPGFLSGAALQQIYSHAGAFVLPSSHEGLPIVLLEAMSYGLPVLASNIPAHLEIGLDPANYFAVGDVAALAELLTRVAQLPQDANARASIARHVAVAYDWQDIAARTLQVYRKVANEPRANAAEH